MKKSIILPLFLGLFISFQASGQIVDKESIVAKNATLEEVGNGYSFTEGPAVHRSGDVYFTDQPNNKIHKWDSSTGEISVFMEDSGRSNGMYFDQSGNLITCADMENQLWSINTKGEVKVLVENFKGKRLNGPNDLWIAPNGGIYFTDPLFKRNYWDRDPEMQQEGEHLYYLSPDKLRFFKVDEDLIKPNGLIGTPDGKKLYVADPGAKKTYVYDIDEDGNLINRKLFAERGSDGMTIDQKGNIYFTGNGITVYNPKGEEIAHIPTEGKGTSNVCFGGEDRKTLFITARSSVYTIKMKNRGVN